MSKTIEITSLSQLSSLLKSSTIAVANFYAEGDAASQRIASAYEKLSTAWTQENTVTFAKINTEVQVEVAATYDVTSLPTFIIFRNGNAVDRMNGADPSRLAALVKKLTVEIATANNSNTPGAGGASGGDVWRGAELPRGYSDITSEVEVRRCELLNVDSEAGGVRVLFESAPPSALSQGGKASADKDWVESDTDEQLLLFLPFQAMLKLHTLQITSLPPKGDDEEDETTMRPKTIKLFTNKPHNLGFDEAEDMAATQVVELGEGDWNDKGTATVPLRFVKFQNVNSLVLFVVDGDGSSDSEKVRIDRIRLIGETGEKREMGKLQKIGDEAGE